MRSLPVFLGLLLTANLLFHFDSSPWFVKFFAPPPVRSPTFFKTPRRPRGPLFFGLLRSHTCRFCEMTFSIPVLSFFFSLADVFPIFISFSVVFVSSFSSVPSLPFFFSPSTKPVLLRSLCFHGLSIHFFPLFLLFPPFDHACPVPRHLPLPPPLSLSASRSKLSTVSFPLGPTFMFTLLNSRGRPHPS